MAQLRPEMSAWPSLVSTARVISLVAPTLYTGMTLQYNAILLPSLFAYSPTPKILVQQWLLAYQAGPIWVPLTLMPGVIANAFLARSTHNPTCRAAHALAALLLAGIAPLTFAYMEPGINGALKWKAKVLGAEEGKRMKEGILGRPSAWHQSATLKARRWAEMTEAKVLVKRWGEVNFWRVVIGSLAVACGGWAVAVAENE